MSLPDSKPAKVVEYDPEDLLEMNETAQRVSLEKQGRAPFLKLAVGETRLYFLKHRPAVTTNKFGAEQVLFRVATTSDDKTWDLAFKMGSPMVRQLSKLLSEEGEFEAAIVRAGEGQNTQYSLKYPVK